MSRLALAALLVAVGVSSFAAEVPAPPASNEPVDPGPVIASPVVLPEVEGDKTIREIVAEGYRVRLDLSGQMLGLDAPKPEDWRVEGELRENDTVTVARATPLMLGRKRLAELAAGQTLSVAAVQEKWIGTFIQREGERLSGWVKRGDVELAGEEVPLQATLRGLTSADFVSASTLAQKAKQFDDGLYAAVELAAQNGAGNFAGKTELLSALVRAYMAQQPEDVGEALVVALSGARLGGLEPRQPWGAIESRMQERTTEFLADDLRSKPIGFYTWSDELTRIFQQDRILQTNLRGIGGGEQLASLLREDEQAWNTYQQYLSLIYRLTNPAPADKRDLAAASEVESAGESGIGLHFFPPSRSHETDLILKLFGNQAIPDDFNLADELLARIQAGDLDLAPRPNSGWYDYQTWSLETLAAPDRAPESARLSLAETYREHLRELCKGVWALTRETHIKQLDIPPAAAEAGEPEPKKIVYIGAQLSQEPTAEFYLRRAVGYRFVRSVLEDTFGAEALTGMHRQTAAGPVAQDLDGELAAMEALFHGAYVATRRELGLPPEAAAVGSGDAAADAASYLAWAANPGHDVDLAQDSRMMVPVFYDLMRRQTKAWVFLGWSSRPLSIGFAQTPPAEVTFEDGSPVPEEKLPELQWYGAYRGLAYPVVAEVYVNRILNRDEFRAHCDTYRTKAAILANLE